MEVSNPNATETAVFLYFKCESENNIISSIHIIIKESNGQYNGYISSRSSIIYQLLHHNDKKCTNNNSVMSHKYLKDMKHETELNTVVCPARG